MTGLEQDSIQAVPWQAMPITEMLQRIHAGDEGALRAVIPLVYDELKKLAAGHLRRESKGRQLETTALVHEAFLRLSGTRHPSYENRAHFFGIASRLMRQILVDMARARATGKRGGLEVQLDEVGAPQWRDHSMLLAINDALERLGQRDPLKMQLIEMRFFGGMTAEESAAVLGMSVHTVRRELRLGQALLYKELAH